MNDLLLPLLVQVGLTFSIAAVLPFRRMRDIRSDRSLLKRGAVDNSVYSDYSRKLANNFSNQFELPTLFYVAIVLLMMSGQGGLMPVAFAWAFVVARIIHTLIHATVNVVMYRFYAFFGSFLALLGLWACVVLAALRAPLGS